MKKKTTVKKGPLGTPLGNPLGYFNSQKAKRSAEPKQNLRKAQNGISVPYMGGTKQNPSNVAPTFDQVGIKNTYQGPLTEKDQLGLDRSFPSTAFAPTLSGKGAPASYSKSGRIHATRSPREQGYMTAEAGEEYSRKRAENYLRSDHKNMKSYNKYPQAEPEDVIFDKRGQAEAEDRKMTYQGDAYKRGGAVKKKMQAGGTTATRGKTKYEYGNTPYPGPNQIFVNKTKTKRSGKTVATNATNELTNYGFKTTIKKTITDKSGNSKTKDIKGTRSNFDKLLRQGQRATEIQRRKSKPVVKVGGSVKRKK